ncbi:hypothetical protein GCM10017044_01710 [Kordiimonas sediminis]|uniref:Ubiquinone biosynthesis protein n=1 Tax=Kordiimonas sediminis TaxID=1735581 RepID=A0A919E4B3_9PROT|nr:Coq4 family protein [Kordiimonas sediminis]GHF11579.1 hypothetical protein GCM10017044_01710 [Kordiimonas sediminis]
MSDIATDFTFKHNPLQFRVAWKALKDLIANKEDTEQVFIIMKALSGSSQSRQFQRFMKTENGQRILRERPVLLNTLMDRDYLASLPVGSVGRTYLSFMEEENLTADGLVEASEVSPIDVESEDFRLYLERMRDVHDLWHVLSGYGRDGFGEACVVAFSYAQTKSLGFAAIALMGGYDFNKKVPGHGIWSAIWQAYRNGRKSAWLPAVMYEEILPRPLEEVRQELNIMPPSKYLGSPEVIAATA